MSFCDYVSSVDHFLETVDHDHVIPKAMERSMNVWSGPDAQTLYVEYDIKDTSFIMEWASKEDYVLLQVDNGLVNCMGGSIRSHDFFEYENKWEKTNSPIEVMDLDINGRRWEGGVKDGKPFGYGIVYNEEGRKEYEGFMMNGMKSCYGIEYYSDFERPAYEGCYLNDQRFGRGSSYDRKGETDHAGLWKQDSPCPLVFNGNTINTYTRSVSIPDNSFDKVNSFVLRRYFHSLNQLVIGNDSFKDTQHIDLSELTQLRSVEIGSDCFSFVQPLYDLVGVFRCSHCRRLRSILIGNRSLSSFSSLELRDLPSLQTVTIGNNCFGDCSSFSLTDLPQLQSITIGESSFGRCHKVVLKNLPCLQRIHLASYVFSDCRLASLENLPTLEIIRLEERCFCGDNSHQGIVKEGCPPTFINRLVMKDLLSLARIEAKEGCFQDIGSVSLENVDRLEEEAIILGSMSFFSVHSLYTSNASALSTVINQKSRLIGRY